jgi:TolB protein
MLLRFASLPLFLGSALTLTAAAQTKPPARPVVDAGFPLASPSAPQVLFISNRGGTNQLYTMSADGTGVRQLTHSAVDIGAAQWLPGGKSILYTTIQGDQTSVYELWPDSARTQLVRTFTGRSLQFSPARDYVLYSVGTSTASHLVRSDPRGLDQRQLTDNASSVRDGVWSPDGRQIAYTVTNKNGTSIWVMNFDGSHPRQVTHLTPQQGAAQMPAWSPDGQLLAFQANATTPRTKATLWILDLRTNAAREVLPHDNGFRDEAPTWFSDGKRLAFQSNRSGRTEVWAVDTDNSDLQQLTGRH